MLIFEIKIKLIILDKLEFLTNKFYVKKHFLLKKKSYYHHKNQLSV